LAWPDGVAAIARGAAQRIGAWALADVTPGRLMPWLAVAFGLGILLYFAAEREPAIWAAGALAAVTAGAAVLARRRSLAAAFGLADRGRGARG
jgi:competence protein ComEC